MSFLPDFGGGITSSASLLVTRWMSSLSPLLPGTITGFGLPQRDLLEVEPQVGLARLGVRAVAGEAVLGEDRQDVAAEVDRLRLAGPHGGRHRAASKDHTRHKTENMKGRGAP